MTTLINLEILMQWPRPWQQLLTRMRWQRQPSCVRSRYRRPQLELLEERLPPAHDTLTTALPLPFQASPVAHVSGTLTTVNQVDLYAVQLGQGDQFSAAINAQQQGSSLQADLRLFDSNGTQLTAMDGGTGVDPQLTFSIPTTGTYFVGVSSSGDGAYDPTTGDNRANGSSTGLYSLSVTDLLARFVSATPLNSGSQALAGTLIGGQPQDFSITVTGDTFLLATAVPQLSPGFEPRLTLYDPTGSLLIQSDQQKPGLASATLEQNLQPGTYYLEVSAAASTSASAVHRAYQLTTTLVSSQAPFAALPVGSEAVAVKVADLGNGHPDIVTANPGDDTVSVLLGNGEGTFQPAESFAVGVQPYAVAVADLGNGHLDIVTANSGDSTVSVLLGNGDGTFQPAVAIAVGTQPDGVTVADLGNGHPDILTANYAANTVSILLGNGEGTFQPAQSVAVGYAPYAVQVADLGNGRPDLVTANYGDNTVSVLLGNGDGTFQPAQAFAVGILPAAVAVANLGNGHLDLVTANSGDNTVSVLLGNGDGTFQPDQAFAVGSAPYGVAVADLGNGRDDLVTANFGADTVSVLLGNGDRTFQPAQDFDVASAPVAVAVADLGNGRPDIVTTNPAANTVSVLLGNDDGTFQPAQSVAVGTNPYAVKVADLGNGRPDIVTANLGANTVSVLLSNGDGTFQPAHSFAVGGAPHSVAVADLGNGHPDIVTANPAADTVSVLLGDGDGTFQLAYSYLVGSEPYEVAVADLGNGQADIITANFGDNTVSVLLGNGDGTFQPAIPYGVGFAPGSVAVADLGNGHLDLVTANAYDNTVSVLLGNGDGTFQTAQAYPVGIAPDEVTVADLGNGHADIVNTNQGDNTVSVLLGNGDGTFQPAQAYPVGYAPDGVAVADLGNGHADIVTTDEGDNTIAVLLGNGDGTFQAAQFDPVGYAPDAVAVANLGNGQPDIVTSNLADNTVSVLLGNGDGTFGPAQAFGVVSGPEALVAANLGNDNTDLVSTNFLVGTVSVSLGNGDGTFQPAQSFAVGNGPDAVAVVDVNNDGRPDVVTANLADNTVSVLLGNGDGTFQSAQTFAVGNGPDAVAVADLGNGQADIVTANYGDNTVSVLLGNGDGTFQPAQTFDVGSEPESVAVADLGNGHPDLITANNGNNTVSVLLGNGDGTFQPAQTFDVGSDPESVAVADLGNGRVDLITANYGASTVSVLLGNGDGTFQPARSFAVGSLPHALAVADLGNGYPDIVTANYGSSTVSVLLGNGDGTFQTAQAFAVANLPESVVVADVNNDGRDDIVTANAGVTGAASVLLNLGHVQFQALTGPTGIPSRDVAVLSDLTGDGITDALSLDQYTGQILFRQGTGDPNNPYAPLVVVNPGRPATDFTLVQTPGLPEIAVLDSLDQLVILYMWSSSAKKLKQIAAFATGPQPVRIASTDLDGNGLGDLVVGNDLDNTLTIALQQTHGTFDIITRAVGAGPSSITFADLNGDHRPDIVVSDQVSGDISILFNDANHSFSTQERYRAGEDPFDVATGANGTTLLTQLQTVGVVAADFTGTGTDLVALNANIHSFTLLRAAGGGSLIDPQLADTYPVGSKAIQALTGDFLHNGLLDLAVLVTSPDDGTSQVLVFPNNGNGTFGDPIVSAAGENATGFSFVPGTASQPDRLVVGDNYGDFLILLGDGAGHFVVDRRGLNGQPLAVIQRQNKPPLVVLANEQTGQVQVFVQSGNTKSGTSPFAPLASLSVPASSITGAPATPGSILLTDLNGATSNGQPVLDLVVADRLGNDVLVFQGNADGTFSATPYSISVGFEPDAIAVGDFNGDGVLDLAVANKGSNDVSILDGQLNNGVWTATHGPRLSSGGSEPIAVSAGNFVHQNLLDLRVTNAGGQVATLPGIGTTKGTGFFQDNQPQVTDLGSTITQAVFDPSNNAEFFVLQDGSLLSLDGTAEIASGVLTASAANGDLVAGLADGAVEVLTESGFGSEEQMPNFSDEPSALDALRNGSQIDVYASYQGLNAPVLFSFPLPVLTELPSTAAVAHATSLPETNLILVGVLVQGNLVEQLTVVTTEPIPNQEAFSVFVLETTVSRNLLTAFVEEKNSDQNAALEGQPVLVRPPDEPLEVQLQSFRLGVEEALQQRMPDRGAANRLGDVLDALPKMLKPLQEFLWQPAPVKPGAAPNKPAADSNEKQTEAEERGRTAEAALGEATMAGEVDVFSQVELLPKGACAPWQVDVEEDEGELVWEEREAVPVRLDEILSVIIITRSVCELIEPGHVFRPSNKDLCKKTAAISIGCRCIPYALLCCLGFGRFLGQL